MPDILQDVKLCIMTKSANGFCSLIEQCNSLIDCFVKFKRFCVESESYCCSLLQEVLTEKNHYHAK